MKRIIQVLILLIGVSQYSQDTLSVKDGAYGYDKDFKLDLHLTTSPLTKDSGTTDGVTTDKLVDSTQDFTSSVSVGDTVNNTTDGTTATITAIDSNTTLSLSSDIMISGEAYSIISNKTIKGLQFDLKYDGSNFTYQSSYSLNKARLGGNSSDHVVTVREVKSGNLRILIYSPSNKLIPTGNGQLLTFDFKNSKNYGNYFFELASVSAAKEDNTNLNLYLEKGTITTLASNFGWNTNITEFGSVYKDGTKNIKWSLINQGTAELNISLSKNELTKFSLTDWDTKSNVITWPQKINPGSQLDINVTVDSSKNGDFIQSLFLNSDDPIDPGTGEQEFKFKAKVFNTNKIVVQSNADAQNKQTSNVKISINGDEDITSFQFDLAASNSNIEFISNSATLLKSGTNHVISSNVIADNSGNKLLRIICYSPTNALLTQPIGEIVKFSVRPDKLVNPGAYPINISNTVLTNKDVTNVSSEAENGSINLITGRLAFNSPTTSDDSKREYVLDLGELFRNSFNEKIISISNNGNKKLTISSVTSSDADMSVSNTFPLELDQNASASEINFKVVPSTNSNNFSAYLKFTHDGGSEKDSVLIKASLINRNIINVKNSNVTKDVVNNVPISLLNSNEIKGMQFDLTVPKESKSFTWTITANSNDDYNFTDEDLNQTADPSITHYVGDEIKFINNSGGTHPLFIVTELGADNGYDSSKQLTGVTNQGTTSETVTVDLSEVLPGTYYYICGNHKSMRGTITVLPKFSINASSSNLVSDRSTDFVLVQSSIGARKYRFLIYSNTNSLFTGNNGNIINLPLNLNKIDNASMVIANGSYDLLVDNIIISGKDNSNVSSESTAKGIIVVGGTNDTAPVVSPNQITSLKENPIANTYFYNIKATDADPNSFIDDFKIVSGNDEGTFGIVSETGDLFVIKPENVDYESKQSHSLGITVSDGTKTSAIEIINVNITDDPNAFVLNNFTVQVYKDNEKSGITYEDSDDISSVASGSDITYELYGGNDKDFFLLNSSSGKLTFKAAPQFSAPLDSGKDNIYQVTIKAIVTDDTSSKIPVFSSEKTVSIKEDSTDALTITSFLATTASDIDGDGIIDSLDNCPNISNVNQRDHDSNGEGNACEDSDGDSKLDNIDNCPIIPNPGQEDADFNGTGDVCEDTDKDGIIDSLDNCISVKNIDQADRDSDGIGDVCDDSDLDGILDSIDNCPTTSNTNQADLDKDGIGDVCDDDKDGDTILNDVDNCPTTANTDQADLDKDGTGDVCDDDKDGDTILNDVDNCPTTANTDQADFDSDGIGDSCDPDIDNDGVLNAADDCDNTPLGSKIDTKGCFIFELPLNNNKVQVNDTSCIGTDDGSIVLSVEDNSKDYTITVTGKSSIAIAGEIKTYTLTGLAKGTYLVCFKVDGQANYEQCFEAVVGEPAALSAFVDVDNDDKTTSISLGGSDSYNVDINGIRYQVKGNRFDANLPTGLSTIRISTDLECQGIIEKEIFISEDILYYPNPTKRDVKVHVSGKDTKVIISVFTTKGDLIFTRDQKILDSRKTELDLSGVPPGTYLVNLEGTTVRKTFKIVKK